MAALDRLRETSRIPGLSVAIVQDGEVVLARGLGFADLEGNLPATAETPYNIASVTKPLSAVVALRLAETGRLDLDRPMAAYEGFADFCREARAGGGLFFDDYSCDAASLTLRHVLSMTANGTPGERFFYNPISYSWASRAMAQSAGVPFSALMTQLVFQPAGMNRSARIHRGLPLSADLTLALARPYHVGPGDTLVRSASPPIQGDGAAGGVVSTVSDLARFDVALDGGRLLTETSRAEMWRPRRSSSGRLLPYGLGWYVQESGGHQLLWHSGWWEQAYSALYLKVPHDRLTVILLANSEGLWWNNPLDGAEIEKSPFASLVLKLFLGGRTP